MNLVSGARASTVLFNFLKSNDQEIKKGKILLPANVCPIVPATIQRCGLEMLFADIDPVTQTVDLDVMNQMLETHEVSCLLFVHSYGRIHNTPDLFALIRKSHPDTVLIDDRCLGRPDLHGTPNADADLVLYSTGYCKFVEFGYGGFGYVSSRMNFNDHPSIYHSESHDALTAMMHKCIISGDELIYKQNDWLIFDDPRMDETYFEKIAQQYDISEQHKSLLNGIYMDAFPKEVILGEDLNLWRFCLQVPKKNELLKAIFDAEGNLFAGSHYASVSHIFGGPHAPVAERIHDSMVNLFNDHRFTESMAVAVAEITNSHLKKHGIA
ncbi:MAG: hypothetical protein KDC76_02635 [Bacteroidetes bacterium]|nr:hypothetical protein [Bacteroidota bacterium]